MKNELLILFLGNIENYLIYYPSFTTYIDFVDITNKK